LLKHESDLARVKRELQRPAPGERERYDDYPPRGGQPPRPRRTN